MGSYVEDSHFTIPSNSCNPGGMWQAANLFTRSGTGTTRNGQKRSHSKDVVPVTGSNDSGGFEWIRLLFRVMVLRIHSPQSYLELVASIGSKLMLYLLSYHRPRIRVDCHRSRTRARSRIHRGLPILNPDPKIVTEGQNGLVSDSVGVGRSAHGHS